MEEAALDLAEGDEVQRGAGKILLVATRTSFSFPQSAALVYFL